MKKLKDEDEYELLHNEYEVHKNNCETMLDLKEKNQYDFEIIKNFIEVLAEKYTNYDFYFLTKTYIYHYNDTNTNSIYDYFINYSIKKDINGWKFKIENSKLANIIRGIWYNENSEYEERNKLFIDEHMFDRVFLYDYDDRIEILIG